jgi:hypothetical protein
MSESLKSLLAQQAASVAFKPPDLEAIASDRKRLIRRRRAVAALASVAAVAVLAGAAVALFRPVIRPPEVAEPVPVDGVSWAAGTTIHVGDDLIEVGHPVRAYVRTSIGFVTLDRDNNVYSVTSRGVTQIGQAAVPARVDQDSVRLVSDPSGALAGWVGYENSVVTLQVHDQATGQTKTFGTQGGTWAGDVTFFAIDGRTGYWRLAATNGVYAVDLDTGDEQQLASGEQGRDLAIWSVEDGVLAFSRNQQPFANVTSLRVGRSLDDAREFTFEENTEVDDAIRLSPTGAWVSYLLITFNGPPVRDDVIGFGAQVRDSGTGEAVNLDLPPNGSFPVVWIDETTLQVMAFDAARASMYACTVPAGTCVVAADLTPAELEGSTMVWPGGVWIHD